MTPLPEALGGGGVWAHRLDRAKHAPTWSGGEGAFQAGGRWNPVGTRAVYCALDPSTAILEVAVHKGFRVLDTQPHVMTAFQVADPTRIKVFAPDDLPDVDWLDPGNATPERRAWGGEQLHKHGIIVIPSAVSRQSWNLIFLAPMVPETFQNLGQTRFVLDPRLNAKQS